MNTKFTIRHSAFRAALLVALALFTSAPRTPGQTGWDNALSFDGVDDFLEVPHTEALNAYPLTVSAWIKTYNWEPNGQAGVINKYVSGSSDGFNLYVHQGRIRAWYFKDRENYVWDGGGGLDGGEVADGAWHHVAFTVGPDGGKLYVDGALQATKVWTGTPGPPTTTEPLRLGLYPPGIDPNGYFSGLMDEVRIWNVERSQAEIAAYMFQPLTGAEPGPLAYWKFDETLASDTAYDNTPNHLDGILAHRPIRLSSTVPPLTLWGNALSFGGVDEFVEVPHTNALNAFPLTVSAWINTTNRGGQVGVINKYVSRSSDGFNLFLFGGEIGAWYYQNSTSYVEGLNGGYVADGAWHHVAFTVGPDGGRLYVDGALKASANWTGTPGPCTTGEPLRLGLYPPGIDLNGYYQGLMDEVRIWNVERSQAEIAAAMFQPLTVTEPSLLAYWKFDEILARDTAFDSTTNHLDGTLLHSIGISMDGIFGWQVQGPTRFPSTALKLTLWGHALSFDDVNEFVEVPDTEALNAFPLTISTWINTTNRDVGRNGGVVNKYLSASGNGFNLYVREGHIRAWYFRDTINYVWDRGQGLEGGDVADGIWHHVAFTVGTNGGKLYVDGALRASTNWTGIPGPCTTQEPLRLGLYPPSNDLSHFIGLMDDVQIWNVERSEAEIVADMFQPLTGAEPGLLAYWRFDEGAGSTALDSTTNGHTGTLQSSPDWTMSKAFSPGEIVVTIYFCGTGITAGWWDGNNSGFGSPELVSTLFHEQIKLSRPIHYRTIVDGIGTHQGWDLLHIFQAFPKDFARGWGTTHNEGMNFLNSVLSAHPQSQIILNLVGFSRGGVSTMKMANAVKDYPRVKRINIIAFDPVPGDGTIDYSILCLPEKVKNYLGFYALDERTDRFEPAVPTPTSPDTKMWMYAVPGSHETMVGNMQADGRSTSPASNTLVNDLRSCSWLTMVMAVELLGSSDCGRVRFNSDWHQGSIQEPVLASEFIRNLGVLGAFTNLFDSMRNISMVDLLLPLKSFRNNECYIIWLWQIGTGIEDLPRCAFHYDCSTGTRMTVGLTNMVPLLDSSAWAMLTEFGSLDFDGDGIDFADDNCPDMFNPDQRDMNGNGIGDVCEAVLAIEGLENGDYSISWVHGSGAVLQTAAQVEGPWTNVVDQPNPYITTPSLPAEFFRLVLDEPAANDMIEISPGTSPVGSPPNP